MTDHSTFDNQYSMGLIPLEDYSFTLRGNKFLVFLHIEVGPLEIPWREIGMLTLVGSRLFAIGNHTVKITCLKLACHSRKAKSHDRLPDTRFYTIFLNPLPKYFLSAGDWAFLSAVLCILTNGGFLLWSSAARKEGFFFFVENWDTYSPVDITIKNLIGFRKKIVICPLKLMASLPT